MFATSFTGHVTLPAEPREHRRGYYYYPSFVEGGRHRRRQALASLAGRGIAGLLKGQALEH